MGEHQRLRDTRMFFQYATVREFCEPVERLTGRKVRAFASALDTEVEGPAVETFILEPPGYRGPSRMDSAEPLPVDEVDPGGAAGPGATDGRRRWARDLMPYRPGA